MPAAARVRAAIDLLDRAGFKPKDQLELEDVTPRVGDEEISAAIREAILRRNALVAAEDRVLLPGAVAEAEVVDGNGSGT